MDAQLTPVHGEGSCLLDIDTHVIKANTKKNEGEHAHHDSLNLAAADSDAPLTAQEGEVMNCSLKAAPNIADRQRLPVI